MRNRLIDQSPRLFARFVGAHQSHKGLLTLFVILAQRFARFFRVAFNIKQVVCGLER